MQTNFALRGIHRSPNYISAISPLCQFENWPFEVGAVLFSHAVDMQSLQELYFGHLSFLKANKVSFISRNAFAAFNG